LRRGNHARVSSW